jgi:BioD-like phosphotransacetylase family protein
MIALYITSPENGSGKTALCAGLFTKLAAAGKKAGYFKPLINPKDRQYSDALFMKQLFQLNEPIETLCPVFTSLQDLTANILQAFNQIASGKDAVIIEGVSENYPGSGRIAEILGAKVLIVEKYSRELFKDTASCRQVGESLSGVILNKVPRKKTEQVRKEASGTLSQAGIKLLGILPEDRALLSISLSQMAEYIHGNFISGEEQSDELIENLVITTTGLDPGPEYYNRKANKALIFTRAPRYRHPSASRSISKCAVLTGPNSTNQTLIDEFKGKNIPVIITEEPVSDVVASLENSIAKARFNQPKKMPVLIELLDRNLDFQTLAREIGITG